MCCRALARRDALMTPDYIDDLRRTVRHAVPALARVTPEASAERPASGKWSPREIVGHLIDSASNNHRRFVLATVQDDLVFQGYAQDDWVAAQRYQDAPWDELVSLWASFNLHLARVMAAIPETVRTRERTRHNLDQIAFNAVPIDRPATLDYFMRDYVEHLKHHLRQILGADWQP
jgi:hypothetical protein